MANGRWVCAECDADLPLPTRADARFCSGRCRVAAHRARVPAELRRLDRWVRRSSRKVPLTVTGRAASSTDRATWCSYRTAVGSSVGDGLGFVLAGDGFVCLDIDHCLTGGVPSPDVAGLLAELPASYVEVSPSGTGLHLWFRGRLPRDGQLVIAGVPVEAYSTGRYITITGRRFGRCPSLLAELPEVVDHGWSRSRPESNALTSA